MTHVKRAMIQVLLWLTEPIGWIAAILTPDEKKAAEERQRAGK